MSGNRRTTRLRLSDVCQALLLTVAATVVWGVAIVFIGGIVDEVMRETTNVVQENHTLTFRHDGLPVWLTTRYRDGLVELSEYRDLDGKLVEMKETDVIAHQHDLIDARIVRRPKRHRWMTETRWLNATAEHFYFFEQMDGRGDFEVIHKKSRRRIGFIGPGGFSEQPLSPDRQYRTRQAGEQAAIVAQHPSEMFSWAGERGMHFNRRDQWLLREPVGQRVHWIDLEQRTSRVVHDGEPVWAVCFDWQGELGQKSLPLESPQIVLRTATALKIVEQTKEGAVRLVEEMPLPSRLHHAAHWRWIRTPDGSLFDLTLDDDRHQLIWTTSAGEVIRERTVESRTPNPDARAFWMLPLMQVPLVGDVLAREMAEEDQSTSEGIDLAKVQALGLTLPRGKRLPIRAAVMPLVVLHVSALVWSVLAVRRLRRYGASAGEQLFWGGWLLIGGLPGYLAFRVHRDWQVGRALLPVAEQLTGKSAHSTVRESVSDRWLRWFVSWGETAAGWADAVAEFVYGVTLRIGLTPGHAALVMKEVRVSLCVVVAAAVGFACMVGKVTEWSGFGFVGQFFGILHSQTPFIGGLSFENVSLAFAVGLAVMQSMSESRHEAWLFALHRPISRQAVVIIKLTVGLVLLLVTTAVPIVVYAVWAARPATHASPFEWGMTEEAWRMWWCVPPAYLGALLMMLRPARWLGTRVLPCVAGLWWINARRPWGLSLWPVGWEFTAVLAIDVVLVICLLLVVREREYP